MNLSDIKIGMVYFRTFSGHFYIADFLTDKGFEKMLREISIESLHRAIDISESINRIEKRSLKKILGAMYKRLTLKTVA